MSDEERRQVLEMLERGQINAEQAVSLLEALGESSDLSDDELPAPEAEASAPVMAEAAPAAGAVPQPGYYAPPAEEAAPASAPADKKASAFTPPAHWKRWWLLPFGVGVAITVVSSWLMYLALDRDGLGFWFACTWFPFSLGLLVLALGWASRSARWLHLRIRQPAGQKPERIAISLPLPLRLLAGLMRFFSPRIPEMANVNLDEMVMVLEQTSPEAPLYLVVNEEDGEHVEIYIG